jgi:hypothetical protein
MYLKPSGARLRIEVCAMAPAEKIIAAPNAIVIVFFIPIFLLLKSKIGQPGPHARCGRKRHAQRQNRMAVKAQFGCARHPQHQRGDGHYHATDQAGLAGCDMAARRAHFRTLLVS